MKFNQLMNIVMDNYFIKNYAWYGGLVPNSRPILIYQPTSINQKQIVMSLWFFTLLNVCTGMIKSNCHQQKNNRLHYTAILSKTLKGLEVVSILHNRSKKCFTWNTCHCLQKHWPNSILVLPRTLQNNWKHNF